VTAVMCLFIINKRKERENQKKRNIKSRKIDKRKRKILLLNCIITQLNLEIKKYFFFIGRTNGRIYKKLLFPF